MGMNIDYTLPTDGKKPDLSCFFVQCGKGVRNIGSHKQNAAKLKPFFGSYIAMVRFRYKKRC